MAEDAFRVQPRRVQLGHRSNVIVFTRPGRVWFGSTSSENARARGPPGGRLRVGRPEVWCPSVRGGRTVTGLDVFVFGGPGGRGGLLLGAKVLL